MERIKEVGEVLVERAKALIDVLAGEPKHSALEVAYSRVKEAVDKILGTPEKHSGQYTEEGHTLLIPAQEPVELHDDWSDAKPDLQVVRPEGWKPTVPAVDAVTEGADFGDASTDHDDDPPKIQDPVA